MPRGRKTALIVDLTATDRRTLAAWQRATAARVGLVRRARIVLLRADGVTITAISKQVGVSRKNCYYWIDRFQRLGPAGLTDSLRRSQRLTKGD